MLPPGDLKDVIDMENKLPCSSLPVISHTFFQFMLPERSFHLNCLCSIALLHHGWVPLGMEKLQFFNIHATDFAVGGFFFPACSCAVSFSQSTLLPIFQHLIPSPILSHFFTSVMSFICFLATARSHLWQSTDANVHNMWSLPLLLKQIFLLFVFIFFISKPLCLWNCDPRFLM